MNYYNVIQTGMKMFYERHKYAYFYGAKGQRLTDATMDALIASEKNYFSRYSATELAQIKNYSRGKIGYDCSGFLSAITGQSNYSTGFYNESLNKTTPTLGTEGNLLYTTFGGTGRHIGLDIGYGYFLHMRKEGNTVEFGKVSDYAWEKSGQIRGVDYTGAKS